LVIRPFNLKNYKVEDENLVYIDENCLKTNGLKKFEKGTLLFSRVGDIKIGVLNKDNATISPNIIAVNFSDIDLTKYLCVFYFSKYGFKQIERQLKVSAQPTISTSIIAELKFPCVSRDLICAISFILDKSHDFLAKSKGCYTQAENLLLNALGIENFSPSTKNTTEKSFKDSFVATGRLDAEYYQPKYDELEAEIAKTNVLIKLKDLLTLNQRGTQPNYAEQGLPVINSKHVREGEVLLTDNRFATLSDKEQPLFIKKGDVLINGTGVGTIGRSACYLHEQNALPDNHVTILRTDSINPIFLSVYLNSIAGKYQVDKYFKGSSGQIELYPKDIDNFYIPLVNEETQTQIANLVQQSFTLKAESERLLDADKRAVEIAIETDEQTAMVYINEQTGEKSCTPKN
jgi:type I restriction enzyme M protein